VPPRRSTGECSETTVRCHSFRTSGIATHLQNGGKLEFARQIAGLESARITGLFRDRNDTVALHDFERVLH